jgi:hypothetical protein
MTKMIRELDGKKITWYFAGVSLFNAHKNIHNTMTLSPQHIAALCVLILFKNALKKNKNLKTLKI